MTAVDMSVKVGEAREQLATALYARDLSAVVVANYVSDRMGTDYLGDLEGVRPAVNQFRSRSVEYHAKRRAHDKLTAEFRAAVAAEETTDQAASAIADLMIIDAELRGRMPEVTA